jgi:cysteine desulfurase
MRQRIYFDANAGAPLLSEVREAMIAALGSGNASSVHTEGRRARSIVEDARREIAAAVCAEPDGVIFTSGATEAAALALTPRFASGSSSLEFGRLYVGATEHPCVLGGGRFPAQRVIRLPVDRDGVIELAALTSALAEHPCENGPPYLALMLANNDTGVIHPVAEAARLAKAKGGIVFCDAAQALGRISISLKELGVDCLAVSAHKAGGPQGIGALVLADEAIRPEPLVTGGGQERWRRAGTENVAAIAGFGVAARLARSHLSNADRIEALRNSLEREICALSPGTRVVGRDAERLPNTTLFIAPGVRGDLAVIAFDLDGIAISSGSACSSGKVGPSHVLAAVGESEEGARSGVRVSLPISATTDEIDSFVAAWRRITERMQLAAAA